MTSSELKYLLALDGLFDGIHGVKLVDVANVLGVTKVSAFKAVQGLQQSELVARDAKSHVIITEKGNEVIRGIAVTVAHIADYFERFCWIDEKTAHAEAVNAVCALSDETRATLAKVIAGN